MFINDYWFFFHLLKLKIYYGNFIMKKISMFIYLQCIVVFLLLVILPGYFIIPCFPA